MFEMKLNFFTNDEKFPFFIQYGTHDENLYIHTHKDFSELVIVLSGTATHIVDDERFYIKKGDVFVINNNTIHGYESTEGFHICNVMYRYNNLLKFDIDIKKNAGFHALFVLEPYLVKENNFKSRLKLKLDDFDRVSNLLDNMMLEYETKQEGWQTFLKGYFLNLVVILSRLYSFKKDSNETKIINIAQSISYIENHFTENLSINLLSDISHYSPRHFVRIFNKIYHTTPTNYILSLRINYACKLLKKSSSSINKIALKSGFKDSNYFSRLFKKRIGISPKDFRKL
jgi:AraC-like DNA-binding protein